MSNNHFADMLLKFWRISILFTYSVTAVMIYFDVMISLFEKQLLISLLQSYWKIR